MSAQETRAAVNAGYEAGFRDGFALGRNRSADCPDQIVLAMSRQLELMDIAEARAAGGPK